MIKNSIAILFLATFTFASQLHGDAPAISETDSVAKVVETLIERHGGIQATERWKCGKLKFTAAAGILPPDLGAATFTEAFDFPNCFKRSAVVDSSEGRIDVTFVINESGGWVATANKPTLQIPRSFADRNLHSFADFYAVIKLREQIESLTIARKLSVDGEPAIQLHLDLPDVGVSDLFISMKSGLLLRSRKTTVDSETGNQATVVTEFGKYQGFDGIPVAMEFSATSNGRQLIDIVIHEIDFKDSIPSSTFAKPK